MIDINTFQIYRFSFQEVCPPVAEIRAFLQSTDLGEDHPVNVFITEILPSLKDNPDIAGGYIIKDLQTLDIPTGRIIIEDTMLPVGKQVCGYLKNSRYAALFVCTAGKLYTELSKQLNERGDFMEAFIVDAIGSLTVEKAMDSIQQQLGDSLQRESLHITNRYSPGYCNWALIEQQTLFGLIGDNPVGISLSESSLMSPVKSVSGMIGIGAEVTQRGYRCQACRDMNCIYRKITNKDKSS